MQDRNRTVQRIVVRRGQRLAVRRSDEMIPPATTIASAQSPAFSQSSVGAYQRPRKNPSAARTLRRYSLAGRMPRSPISPWI